MLQLIKARHNRDNLRNKIVTGGVFIPHIYIYIYIFVDMYRYCYYPPTNKNEMHFLSAKNSKPEL